MTKENEEKVIDLNDMINAEESFPEGGCEKAVKFDAFMKEKEIGYFHKDLYDDGLHTAIYRAHMAINGRPQPVMIILDDSFFGMIKVLVAHEVVKEKNKAEVEAYLNVLNETLKGFKYYVDRAGNVCLDVCIINNPADFNAETVLEMLDILMAHLQEEEAKIMDMLKESLK